MPNNLTDAEEIRLLDLSLVDGDLLALTTTLPTDSTAGTEVVGGSYARQVIDWAAAAAGAKSTAAAIAFSALPAVAVVGWEVWDTTGAARRWYGLFATLSATAQATGDTITATAHGFADGQKIVFQTDYTPAGLTAGTTYFVRDSLANTFTVAATLGGVAIDITADNANVVVGKVLEVTAGSGVNVATGAITCTLA